MPWRAPSGRNTPLHSASGRQNAQALVIRKAYAVVCVVGTPHALTLVVRKKYALTLCV